MRQGLVFSQVPRFLADPYLRRGDIVRVLEDHEPEPWTLFPYRRSMVPYQGASGFRSMNWRPASLTVWKVVDGDEFGNLP